MNIPEQNPRRGSRALSLVEVMMAVGICAVTVVGVVALFGPAVRATREVADRRTAHRLAENVKVELRQGGYEALASATVAVERLQLVARAEGGQIARLADADNPPEGGTPAGIPPAERYFLIEVARALRPASTPACLVLEVRVSWPYALPPDGNPVAVAERSEFRFHTAINR